MTTIGSPASIIGVYLCHVTRSVILTELAGEPALSAEHVGDYPSYFDAHCSASKQNAETGYDLHYRLWNASIHAPDALRGYEVLPFDAIAVEDKNNGLV